MGEHAPAVKAPDDTPFMGLAGNGGIPALSANAIWKFLMKKTKESRCGHAPGDSKQINFNDAVKHQRLMAMPDAERPSALADSAGKLKDEERDKLIAEVVRGMLRKDLPPEAIESAIQAFTSSPPPDLDEMLAQHQLDAQWPPTTLSVAEVKQTLSNAAPPAFSTPRLHVWVTPIALENMDGPARIMYSAFPRKDSCTARVAASAVVGFSFIKYPTLQPSVEWIEVPPASQGQGLGVELLDGIEKHTGWTLWLISAPVKLIEALAEARRARGAVCGNQGGEPATT